MTAELGHHRGRNVDLTGVGLCLTAAAVFLAHGLHGRLERDLAIYTYAGQSVADGTPPYLGVFNRAGPLSHLVPGVGIWVGRIVGVGDVVSARLLFLVISVAAVVAMYRLARSLTGSTAIGAATGLTLLMVQGFVDYASRGPREKTLMVLLLILALHAIVRRRWGLAGAMIALATLTWQPVFFAAAAAAATGLFLEPVGRRLRGLVRVVVGGLIPLLGFLIWYAAIGHLRVFLDGLVLVHVRYTRQPSMLTGFGHHVDDLRQAYGLSLYVLVAGLLTVVVRGVIGLARVVGSRGDGGRERADEEAVVLLAGGVVAVVWTVRAYNGWPDAFLAIPFGVLGVGLLLGAVLRRASTRVVLAVVAAWATLSVLLGTTYAVSHRTDDLAEQRARAVTLMRILGPDATMMSIQAPAPLVLTGRRNPIVHQQFSLGLEDYVDDVWPGGLDGLVTWVLDRRPTVLVVESGFRPSWVQEVIDEGYVRVGMDPVGRYGFFVSDEVPQDEVARARRALRG
ncbi:glycosyltransferase family 39 protein [Nocardioides sp. URHA0032]|uniref:glycosyltransferase family 39 protein n=1 Tax=Nocardioides sp. URHA0032 TaxID=1380388 RepID=UPI0012DC082D|nr:glycosyltransferase family 39 protein [Nocardioides sp. URHA0032]